MPPKQLIPGESTEPDNAENSVVTRDLTRRFGALCAVDALCLEVPAGAIFGLLGPNGAGKSTTIKMLTTLLPPSSGTATVSGLDIERNPRAVRRCIGYVPQVVSADGSLSGFENLLLFAKLYGLPKDVRQERIETALGFVGLLEARNTLVQKYSGGMVRRLEIALAIMHQPPVLVLDEPTVGLDPIARHAVWDHLQAFRDQAGTTILITTHHMNEAEALCDQIAIMDEGTVRAVGSPGELKMRVGDGSSLNDVFVHFTGEGARTRGGYQEAVRVRHNARRLN